MRLCTSPFAVLAAAAIVLVPTAAPDRKPPRIVAAAMVDLNGNARADRVRLTYSERIRHVRDHDGSTRSPWRGTESWLSVQHRASHS